MQQSTHRLHSFHFIGLRSLRSFLLPLFSPELRPPFAALRCLNSQHSFVSRRTLLGTEHHVLDRKHASITVFDKIGYREHAVVVIACVVCVYCVVSCAVCGVKHQWQFLHAAHRDVHIHSIYRRAQRLFNTACLPSSPPFLTPSASSSSTSLLSASLCLTTSNRANSGT